MKVLTYFRKRGLALFLALAMCLTVLPGVALAEGETEDLAEEIPSSTEPLAAQPVLLSDSDAQPDDPTVTLKVFYYDAASDPDNQANKEGWNVSGGVWNNNNYYNLAEIQVPLSVLAGSNLGNNSSMELDASTNAELMKALEAQLDKIEWNGSKPTVNLDLVTLGKLSNQGSGNWHLDVTYNDEAKDQDSVYVYMDATTGVDGLTEAEKEILNQLTDLYKNRWATLGKIERIDLENSESIDWDALMASYAESDPNFTAFQKDGTNYLTALGSLLESLTWTFQATNAGANWGNSSLVGTDKNTAHLNGEITYFEVTYGEQLDDNAETSLEGGPSSILKNKTVSELQTTLNGNGYTFQGWFLEDGRQFIPGVTKITDNTHLVAKWTSPTPEEPEIIIPIEFPDDIAPAPTPGTTTTIEDEETPLAGSVGLNNTDHFAYIEGYNDGTVRPLANMTRAEAVTIFFRLMDDEYRLANWSTENSYTDVNAGDWYNNAVSTCANAGILDAFTGSEFLPNQPITRAEFAVIAAGFAGEEFTGESVGDFDDTVGHWAAAEIRKAAEAGWIHGDKGSFKPDELINRAEVVTLINNMLDRIPDAEHMLPEMKTFIDNEEGEWYYEAIQEAANGHEYERDELGVVETWTDLQAERDWTALEAEWAAAAAAAAAEEE